MVKTIRHKFTRLFNAPRPQEAFECGSLHDKDFAELADQDAMRARAHVQNVTGAQLNFR